VTARRETLLKKLADPNDQDDPRWLSHRLAAVDAFAAKKEKARAQKQRERKRGSARRNKAAVDA
jgi:hypothetical protein